MCFSCNQRKFTYLNFLNRSEALCFSQELVLILLTSYTFYMKSSSDRFRHTHLIQLLDGYDRQHAPIDFYLSSYFREHKALGSKDRAYISEEVYRLIRWKGLLDYLLEREKLAPTWQNRLMMLQARDPHAYLGDDTIPQHIRLSLPKELFQALVRSWGEEKAKLIALASLSSAPTFIRVNLLKISREELLERLTRQGYNVSAGVDSQTAIVFHKKVNFFTLAEFREGLFEVQDEASQLVALAIKPKLHDQVLDFCAGSGESPLLLRRFFKGTGQIFLHDIRAHALQDAKKRLKRAGIHNAQLVHSEDAKRLKNSKNRWIGCLWMPPVLVPEHCVAIPI